MPITISPLDLVLDTQNPRFVILASREQADIRKYLITYEDVCQLALAINEYGSLLPGERIVVLKENGKYVVIEGNRRTCCLQLLLSRDLIPEGFAHHIPQTSVKIFENCHSIEVDVLPDRNAALELMTKRHIQGVKEWRPLAKKQFFASNYNDGLGQTVNNLSKITGIKESDIKEDIRDYKFFSAVYEQYCTDHPDFNKEIVVLKTDPFWRIFKSKFEFPIGTKLSPKDFLKISYDEKFNTISSLPPPLFDKITQITFEKSIVHESITTRHTLTDIEEIGPLLQAIKDIIEAESQSEGDVPAENGTDARTNGNQQPPADNDDGPTPPQNYPIGGRPGGHGDNSNGSNDNNNGGPRPGGPPPRVLFESLSWRGKLNSANQLHQGLLSAINELYGLSDKTFGRQKAYRVFPVATGMILRTVYEQALRLRLMQVNLWGKYMVSIKNGKKEPLPTLSTMENFISAGENKPCVLPNQNMILSFDIVIANQHRDFLNANIHRPGDICVTPDSLEAIAAGGMHSLIQGIINLIE